MKKTNFIFLFFFFISVIFASTWEKNNPNSKEKIQHQVWDDFLQKNIIPKDKLNTISYGAVSKEYKRTLDNYLKYLQEIKITNYNQQEQKAYWINLYNSLTVQVVLDHYPVDSIRDIKLSGVFTIGPWKKKLVSVEREMLTLDDIEHKILRPIWKDNRVHYAVNCASVGCPNLQNRAFTADNIENLLEKGAKEYIQSPNGVSFQNNQLVISSIYKWFQEDFSTTPQGVLKHLQKYATADTKEKLANYQGKIKYEYNWSLNE